MACAIHALGHFDDFFMSTAGYDSALYSTHNSLSCEPLGAGAFVQKEQAPVVSTQQSLLSYRIYDWPLRALGLALYLLMYGANRRMRLL
jgi:hypothetical protein